MERGTVEAIQLFRDLFASHSAHIALLDRDGVILTVNNAWLTFGRANGLDPDYQFENRDYVDVCHRASVMKSPQAQDAMLGLLRVLKAGQRHYSMLYPCHSPTEPRWFRMWVQTQRPEVDAVVVAHTYLGRELSDADKKQQADRPATPGDRPVHDAVGYPWLHMGFIAG